MPVTCVFSTAGKNIFEGDEIIFEIAQDTKEFRKGGAITGIILNYRPNGFYGQEAQLTVGNFRDENGRKINGKLYLDGNSHPNAEEYFKNGTPAVIIRGGEIVLKEQVLNIVVNTKPEAQKIPLKITPDQKISTCNNEIQIGDEIVFRTVNGNEYIPKGTKVTGVVDYVTENGWWLDNAQIDFKTFKIGSKIINHPVSINGFEILKYKGSPKAQFFNYAGTVFRGKEIEIIPEKDNVQFTIWAPDISE
ncbi:MAG: hypothetical protein LBK53_02155 [Heliobacteriaceae bacterium]|nr:hypothetical protein [Heliobacteriaceae bacterium]